MSRARQKARELVRSLMPKYPLDIVQFANLLGLAKPVEFHKRRGLPDEVSALVIDKDWYGSIHILSNANHPITRQRFRCVHELAHLYLEHKGRLHFYSPGNWCHEDPVEHNEADIFATEVLMPVFHVIELASQVKNPLKLLQAMQLKFGVSLEAAARRIIELEIYKNSACILLRDGQVVFAYETPDFYLSWETIHECLGELFHNMKPGQEKAWLLNNFTIYASKKQKGFILAVLVENQVRI
ncbi:protein of unknown function [Thermanaeromonas toyohensis ToBE]|uniref:IrrE N-terminal-like domain-containing protein n=1 Tax=Thermanaeromonas toyohensis ToBE TaxID=698762 RepID=A0A1W1VRG1_9FIRM|nr:ImmA/IrrE family metallo-endopeptidase [Thermanaeromonas toyohensis]SMB95965.1 protein of unknown function [Thermanaeromonas toyohensis ToBE]